jgi:hypothetical protein
MYIWINGKKNLSFITWLFIHKIKMMDTSNLSSCPLFLWFFFPFMVRTKPTYSALAGPVPGRNQQAGLMVYWWAETSCCLLVASCVQITFFPECCGRKVAQEWDHCQEDRGRMTGHQILNTIPLSQNSGSKNSSESMMNPLAKLISWKVHVKFGVSLQNI